MLEDVKYNSYFGNPLPVGFSENHGNPKDCQLLVALTGTKEFVRNRLIDIKDELYSDYGKSIQGINIHGDGTVDVKTPVWDRRTY